MLYASATGTSKRLATSLVQQAAATAAAAGKQGAAAAAAAAAGAPSAELQLQELSSYEVEGLLAEKVVILVLPTHDGGKPPAAAAWFCR